MIIHSTGKGFDHIEIMLRNMYSDDPKYNNTVIVLGYVAIQGGFDTIKNLYPTQRIITFQLEQLFKGSRWVAKPHIDFLRRSDVVWDYDQQNMKFLAQNFNIHTELFVLKYVPQLTRMKLLPKNEHDIDILFYGSLNDRRNRIINDIKALLPNLNIIASNTLWDDELDDHIQRSKIMLNLHFYSDNRLEQARIFYLLSNHKCVVSEHSKVNYYKNGIIMNDAKSLALTCNDLIRSGDWYKYANESLRTLILSNELYNRKGTP